MNKFLNTPSALYKTIDITPHPISMVFTNTQNRVIGHFKEVDGRLTFEGDVDESANMFVNNIINIFNQRIEYLINNQSK